MRAVAGDRVRVSPRGRVADLRRSPRRAAEPAAPGRVLPGDIVTHREALAGLLADPRVVTGTLLGGGWRARQFAFRVRANRGRVISAASPFHAAARPTSAFLGVLKVAAADRAGARRRRPARLAELRRRPPPSGARSSSASSDMWRGALWRAAQRGDGRRPTRATARTSPRTTPGDAPESEPDARGRRARRPRTRRAARSSPPRREDATALLLVGLVRAGAHVGAHRLRRLFWARPLSPRAAEQAERADPRLRRGQGPARLGGEGHRRLLHHLLRQPVLALHRALGARAAASRRTRSRPSRCSIGFLAAAAFATGERWGLVAGAILLQAAFTTDCVDGQLARYTRTFSKLGAWLDSIFDRTKEYVVLRRPGDRRQPRRATPRGCSPARRSRCRPRATRWTSRSAPASRA